MDWDLIDSGLAIALDWDWICAGLTIDWVRIGIGLASDWLQIDTVRAPQGRNRPPTKPAVGPHRTLVPLLLTELSPCDADWHLIDTGLGLD